MSLKVGFVPVIHFNAKNRLFLEVRRCVPLGLLSLIAVLEREGFASDLIDLNHILSSECVPAAHIEERLLQVLEAQAENYDILGFSTIGGSIQHSLTLAQAYKARHPKCTIIFGGPHASVTAQEILEKFEFVDLVVRGEAEGTIVPLVRAVQDKESLCNIEGLYYRKGTNQICFSGTPAPLNLDDIPPPAYHRLTWLNSSSTVPLDVGRGCPYSCTFCSTSVFWGRKYRLKSVGRIIKEMTHLKEKYGVQSFELTHDIFTLDKAGVEKFCDDLLHANLNVKWSCSTRINLVDKPLLLKMKKSGLFEIFFGIETADADLQKAIRKNIDVRQVNVKIEMVHKAGVRSILSFIVGFPKETREQLEKTLALALDVSARYDADVPIQFLVPFPATQLFQEFGCLLKFDSSFDHAVVNSLLLKQSPSLFSSYYRYPLGCYSQEEYNKILTFFAEIVSRFRKTIWSLVLFDGRLVVDLFEDWLKSDQEIGSWINQFIGEIPSDYLKDLLLWEQALTRARENQEGSFFVRQKYPFLQNYHERPDQMSIPLARSELIKLSATSTGVSGELVSEEPSCI